VKIPYVPQLLTSLVAHDDVAARDRPDAGPIYVPARVIHRETVNDDVAGFFEVDAVSRLVVATFDDDTRVC
jgi:hypothetical protein